MTTSGRLSISGRPTGEGAWRRHVAEQVSVLPAAGTGVALGFSLPPGATVELVAAEHLRHRRVPGSTACDVIWDRLPRPGDRGSKRAWHDRLAAHWGGRALLAGDVWADVGLGVHRLGAAAAAAAAAWTTPLSQHDALCSDCRQPAFTVRRRCRPDRQDAGGPHLRPPQR